MWSIFCRGEQKPNFGMTCYLAVLSRRSPNNVNWNSCIHLSGQKRGMTELECIWPVMLTGECPKFISSPGLNNDNFNNFCKCYVQLLNFKKVIEPLFWWISQWKNVTRGHDQLHVVVVDGCCHWMCPVHCFQSLLGCPLHPPSHSSSLLFSSNSESGSANASSRTASGECLRPQGQDAILFSQRKLKKLSYPF